MLRKTLAAFLSSLLLLWVCGSAQADKPRANRVEVRYIEPKSTSLRPVYLYVKEAKGLEKIKAFLRPLRLPHTLLIQTKDCNGVSNAWYENDTVTICYEFLEDIWKNAATETTPAGIVPIDTVVGPFVDVVLHEVGHAVFDLLDVPIFGREEDAADAFSTYLMLQSGKNDARRLIEGNAYQYKKELQNRQRSMALEKFADEHGTPAQRFFNVLCLAYGADPKLFKDVVEKGYLPKDRAEGCESEYEEAAYAFNTLIKPHIDRRLARKYHRSWLPPVDKRPRRHPAPSD